MKVKNIFLEGKMNKDLDERLVPKGQYTDAQNIRVSNSNGSDVGAVENALSNEVLTDLDFGDTPRCIGSCTNSSDRKMYWFVVSNDGSFIAEYDEKNDTSEIVLEDRREGTTNILGFTPGDLIDCDVLVDDDNEKVYIYFTNGVSAPKKIEVGHAKTLTASEFTFDDVSVIVKPPINRPDIAPKTTSSDLERKNNLKEKFIMFSYRYKYRDDQYSAMSPFSNVAFLPDSYHFNFEDHTLDCMVNIYDEVDITFNTGGVNVQEVDVLFKESGQSTVYLARTFNKEDEGYGDDEEQTFTFSNNQIYKVLPDKELLRLYDNVPLTAKTQEIINNRLVYGNYTENYDLVDADGNQVNPDLTLSYDNKVQVEGEAYTSVKSNRDYEVGIVYLDEHGRSTTVLTGGDNSTYVKPYSSLRKNELSVFISHKAPKWAKYYRFFIKESVTSYDNIMSAVFEVDDDENDIYVKIGGDDPNKVKDGDFITMKRGTSGVMSVTEDLKVNNVKRQERNFLDYDDSATDTEQEPGVYMSLAQKGSFLIQGTSFTDADRGGTERATGSGSELFEGRSSNVTDGPYFYGSNEDANDLNFVSATYNTSNTNHARIEIEISSKGTTNDKFRWRRRFRKSSTWGNWTDEIDCTTSNYTIELNTGEEVVVNFGSANGHEIGDRWTLNYKPGNAWHNGDDYNHHRRAYAHIRFNTPYENGIEAGSVFDIYLETRKGTSHRLTTYQTDTITADRKYDTFEELWHEMNLWKGLAEANIPEDCISFRRGDRTAGATNRDRLTFTENTSDPLLMVLESQHRRATRNEYRICKSEIVLNMKLSEEQNSTFLAETKPETVNNDIYYEIGKTYSLSSIGYHLGDAEANDIDQDFQTDAVITLDFFNCFAWANGHESIKIKDSFFGNRYSFDTRPLTSIEKYQENERRSSLTYSNVYDQTTNYNGLNEFNLSTANYKDLDDADGDIQNIMSRDTNLIVFQENKISQVLYNKNVLFTATGQGDVSQSTEILGQQIPYLGEYGVTTSPHTVTRWGGRIYAADPRRGCVLRISQDGITEISQYGMRDWFRDNMSPTNGNFLIGGYDPINGQYVLSIQDSVEEWREDSTTCELFTWKVDTFDCEDLPFECSDAGFTMSGGVAGASTSGQGSVTSGTITSISPATYTSGPATYTATITVPSGWSNAGESIECTATATGTATTTTTEAPTTTTTLATFSCTTAGFSMSDAQTGQSSTSHGSVSTGTITAISPSTIQTGSNTYTATITVPSGYSNSGQSITCTDTATGTATTTLATFTCTTANFSMTNGVEGSSTSGQGSVSAGTITAISPTTYTSGSATYTATITVPSGYTNSGQSISCTATATGSATTTLATFTCTTASFSMSDGASGASTSGQGTVSAGTITAISPSTYTAGSSTYTATITVPSGYTNSGQSISCTATATGTTTLPVFTCTTANFTMQAGTQGDSTSGRGSVSAGTITAISPTTYQSGTSTYTATITVPSGYSNSGQSITCTASATASTTTNCIDRTVQMSGPWNFNLVCQQSPNTTFYKDGASSTVEVGDRIYTANLCSAVYYPTAGYYVTQDGTFVEINNQGQVTSKTACEEV